MAGTELPKNRRLNYTEATGFGNRYIRAWSEVWAAAEAVSTVLIINKTHARFEI
jgi:hypothetical protein